MESEEMKAWANRTVKVARLECHEIEDLEIRAIEGIHRVREIVGTVSHGKKSVFGNMLYGMAGQFDMALMKHYPTQLGEILVKTVSQTPSYKTTENGLMPAQIFNHMQRLGGHNSGSIERFQRPLSKVGHKDKAGILVLLMEPLLDLFQLYDKSSLLVK